MNVLKKTSVLAQKVSNKLRYIGKLVVTTPKYGLILALQFFSGAFSFIGLPLLVPVLNYMKEGADLTKKESTFAVMENGLNAIGIEPNFYSILIVATGLIFLGQLLVTISTLIAVYVQSELSEEYRKKIFTAYNKASWLWLLDSRSGEINFSVIREADVASVAHLNAQRVVIYLIQIIIFLVVAFKISFTITIMAMGLYAALTVINTINSIRVLELGYDYTRKSAQLSNDVTVLQQNKKFFKTSLLNTKLIKTVFNLAEDITRILKKQIFRLEMQRSWTLFTTFLFLAALMFFHERLNLQYSELFLILLIFLRIGPNFTMLSAAYTTLDSNIPMYQSIQNRLNDLSDHQEDNGDQEFRVNSPIRFDRVSFSYPSGKKVFDEFDVTIEPNKTTAFIGSSGVGKSTLLDLILGLLKPKSGKIYYGDISDEALDKSSLRKRIAYVSQETTLMDGTMRENLSIRADDVSNERIDEVLMKVGLDEVVNKMPEGLETHIGENGVKLSGGQRQRVALARALFVEPKILILDEATSSLDSESEVLLQKTIKKLQSEFTVIIVTHKLSAVRSADTIYVLEDGKVCESGSYQELLNQKGRLHHFDSLQH